jgi:hypothetical protein
VGGGIFQRSFRKALAAIPLGLATVALPMVAHPASAHETPAYSHDSSTGETNPDWMSNLPDFVGVGVGMVPVRLSHLSVPGTHDSGARTWGDAVEAQSMDIPTQLQAGIRALDIRLGDSLLCPNIGVDDFQVMHGDKIPFPGQYCQPDRFSDVLNDVDSFLSQHKREAVLMRISQETPEGSTIFAPSNDHFSEVVNRLLQGLNSKSNRVYTGVDPDPRLTDIRGQIVVLTQYGTATVPAWPGNIKWGDLNKQDAYTIPSNWDLAMKWNGAGSGQCEKGNDHPDQCNNVVYQFTQANTVTCDPRKSEACGGGSANDIYVNHLSGSTGGFPYFFASGHSNPATDAPRLSTGATRGTIDTCSAAECLNQQYYPSVDCAGCEYCDAGFQTRTCTVAFEGLNVLAMQYINDSEGDSYQWIWRTGIVMADFPGKGLISAIIAVNTRRFNHNDYDVGVIPPTVSGCSKPGDPEDPEDNVAIYMDDEDHDNKNSAGGWNGGITQDHFGTTFRFCRVDGSKFHPFNSAGVGILNYAVLRLGNFCPPGSFEFIRYFDNEDEDNTDFIVGDAWPNRQPNADTELHFCLFPPTQDGINSFPSFTNLPNGYGVFAPQAFLGPGTLSHGALFIDDEDYHPSDNLYWPINLGLAAAIEVGTIVQVGDGGQDTGLGLAQVGGQCDSAPPQALCDDGDLCTINDVCLGQACRGTPVLCADGTPPDQCHLAGVCDPNTGNCINPPAPDGTTCDDGDPCTVNDQCKGGACAGTSLCAAPDGCHLTATCDPVTHACNAAHPVPDGTPCDDGNDCTTPDECIAGVCTGTALPDNTSCHVGNPCLSEFCFKGACAGGEYAAAGTPCDDHNVCTTNDQCDGSGHCTGTRANDGVPCPGQPCSSRVCASGFCALAANFPDGTPCDDGNPCTAGSELRQYGVKNSGGMTDPCVVDHCDQCEAGSCTGGTNICAVAAAPAPTATASTSPTPTITPAPNPCLDAPPDAVCDDGDPCTTNDVCLAGACHGDPVVCTAQDQCHLAGTCDPSSGICSNPAAPDGTACDDGDTCTSNDQCTAGTCAGTGACTATATPITLVTPTTTSAAAATSTATAVAATGSPAATETPCPEQTATGGPSCAGDCNGDGSVRVNELIIGVNIALGNASVCVCPSFDRDFNRTVSINELIAAVLAALEGCPS